jgi:hypothetical protein
MEGKVDPLTIEQFKYNPEPAAHIKFTYYTPEMTKAGGNNN